MSIDSFRNWNSAINSRCRAFTKAVSQQPLIKHFDAKVTNPIARIISANLITIFTDAKEKDPVLLKHRFVTVAYNINTLFLVKNIATLILGMSSTTPLGFAIKILAGRVLGRCIHDKDITLSNFSLRRAVLNLKGKAYEIGTNITNEGITTSRCGKRFLGIFRTVH